MKCERCHRHKNCNLLRYARETLPYLTEIKGDSEWERRHNLSRALRGNATSPGFVEDWIIDKAMTPRDVRLLTNEILNEGASLERLVKRCRHYLGPEQENHEKE